MGDLLFIRGGAIGDFILTLPAIQLVRESLPHAKIEVLGYNPVTQLAQAANLVERTRSIEHGPLANFFAPGATLEPELMAYFGKFDVVISYLYDPDGFFEGNLKRCDVDSLLTGPHKVDESLINEPASVQLARPLEQLALFLDNPHPQLTLCETQAKATAGPLTIAIHPGSGSTRKNWSLDHWADVAAELCRRTDAHFLVITGEAEERTAAEFLTLLQTRLVPSTHLECESLTTVGATLQHRCDLFLGHDSGISHLAAACGVPAVLLFGPTDPRLWAPQNSSTLTIRAEDGDLSKISVTEVVARASEVLAREK